MQRSRSRNRYGGKTQFEILRDAAQAAALANGASLWYAGRQQDLAGFVFQDSAGTTPATGTDPIGLLRDRTGAFNATQATAANKPTLELQGNGYFGMRCGPTLDDSLTTVLTATSTVTFGAALRPRVLQNSTAMGTDGLTYAAKACAFKLRSNGDIWLLGAAVGTTPVAVAAYSVNAPVVVRGKVVTGTRTLFVNGVQADSRAGTFTPGLEVVQIGQGNNAEFFDGLVGAAWWANSDVSNSDALILDRFCSLIVGGVL